MADVAAGSGGCRRGSIAGTVVKRRPAGFTLLEVLLATVLLAAGLALAFATLRSAAQIVERGEVVASRSEQIRAVEGFLRRSIASAQSIAFAADPVTLRPLRFVGEPRRMRFVADLPHYLGRGGPYLHDIAVDERGRLLASFVMVQSGRAVVEADPPPPETLAESLRLVRFRYRGLDQERRLGEWEERWDAAESLPVQVAVDIESADGASWPPLLVTLARGHGVHERATP